MKWLNLLAWNKVHVKGIPGLCEPLHHRFVHGLPGLVSDNPSNQETSPRYWYDF